MMKGRILIKTMNWRRRQTATYSVVIWWCCLLSYRKFPPNPLVFYQHECTIFKNRLVVSSFLSLNSKNDNF